MILKRNFLKFDHLTLIKTIIKIINIYYLGYY
jgi:hypothetical protein